VARVRYCPDRPLVINEVFYDAVGSDGARVFTELYGPAGLSLAGYALLGIDDEDGDVYRTVTLPATAVIPGDGLYVVATSAAADAALAARDAVGDVDWQNGPGDAVRLVAPGGAVVDTVQYGDSGLALGEGTAAQDVPAGSSLTRNAAHADTNDNATDFARDTTPSPGEP
jgi:hypothetical protein